MRTADTLKPCFVIAPIGEEGSDTRKRSDQVLKHIVKPAAEACGYAAVRADEIDKPGLITSQVIQRVVMDQLVIADLTETNPNVFYELAIRHAIRKPLVQIIEKGQRIPFDVAGTRTVHVDHRDLDSVDNAKKEIISQIRSLEKSPDDMETPISVSLDLQKLTQSENPADRNLGEILAEISEMRISISKFAEQSNGPNTAELKQIRMYLERLIESSDSRFDMRGRNSERYIHMAMSEMRHSGDQSQRALIYASLAHAAKDRIPWIYEGAIEVFKQLSFGSPTKATETEARFRKLVKSSMESSLMKDNMGRDRETFRLIEMITHLSF